MYGSVIVSRLMIWLNSVESLRLLMKNKQLVHFSKVWASRYHDNDVLLVQADDPEGNYSEIYGN